MWKTRIRQIALFVLVIYACRVVSDLLKDEVGYHQYIDAFIVATYDGKMDDLVEFIEVDGILSHPEYFWILGDNPPLYDDHSEDAKIDEAKNLIMTLYYVEEH
jgi:hypothetical protein